MNDRKTQLEVLVAQFPRLFKGNLPELGIAIDSGWDRILRTLLTEIDRLLTDKQAELFSFEQIKEKFGGLRVYYRTGKSSGMVIDFLSQAGNMTMRRPPKSPSGFPREELDALIAKAAAQAEVTCERCGAPGSLRSSRSWMQVRCDACEKALGQET